MQSDIVVRYLTTYCSTAVCKTCRLMPCHGTRPRLRLKIKRKRKKKKEKRPLRNVSNCMDFIVSNPQYFSKITSHCSTACRVIPSTISAHLTWSHKQQRMGMKALESDKMLFALISKTFCLWWRNTKQYSSDILVLIRRIKPQHLHICKQSVLARTTSLRVKLS